MTVFNFFQTPLPVISIEISFIIGL